VANSAGWRLACRFRRRDVLRCQALCLPGRRRPTPPADRFRRRPRAWRGDRCGDADPFLGFRRWVDEARVTAPGWPAVMTLATVGADGRPSSRAVLMTDCDGRGLVFLTDDRSRKAGDLAANPWAPGQDEVIADRAVLERRVKDAERRFGGSVVPGRRGGGRTASIPSSSSSGSSAPTPSMTGSAIACSTMAPGPSNVSRPEPRGSATPSRGGSRWRFGTPAPSPSRSCHAARARKRSVGAGQSLTMCSRPWGLIVADAAVRRRCGQWPRARSRQAPLRTMTRQPRLVTVSGAVTVSATLAGRWWVRR